MRAKHNSNYNTLGSESSTMMFNQHDYGMSRYKSKASLESKKASIKKDLSRQRLNFIRRRSSAEKKTFEFYNYNPENRNPKENPNFNLRSGVTRGGKMNDFETFRDRNYANMVASKNSRRNEAGSFKYGSDFGSRKYHGDPYEGRYRPRRIGEEVEERGFQNFREKNWDENVRSSIRNIDYDNRDCDFGRRGGNLGKVGNEKNNFVMKTPSEGIRKSNFALNGCHKLSFGGQVESFGNKIQSSENKKSLVEVNRREESLHRRSRDTDYSRIMGSTYESTLSNFESVKVNLDNMNDQNVPNISTSSRFSSVYTTNSKYIQKNSSPKFTQNTTSNHLISSNDVKGLTLEVKSLKMRVISPEKLKEEVKSYEKKEPILSRQGHLILPSEEYISRVTSISPNIALLTTTQKESKIFNKRTKKILTKFQLPKKSSKNFHD